MKIKADWGAMICRSGECVADGRGSDLMKGLEEEGNDVMSRSGRFKTASSGFVASEKCFLGVIVK